MKKDEKSSSAGTEVDSDSITDNIPVCQPIAKPNVGGSLSDKPALRNILIDAMEWGGKFKWQYIEYSSDTWTIPCLITLERLNQVCHDLSIKKVSIELDV